VEERAKTAQRNYQGLSKKNFDFYPSLFSGRPDMFAEKMAKIVAQPIFCQNLYVTFTVEKVAKKFGVFL
jgi:hypothetical protein